MIELFAELVSLCNDRIFARADFQLVAVGIFEEQRVVSRTITGANFRAFQIFAADFMHEFRKAVDFVARDRPKRDARSVWLMIWICGKSKKEGLSSPTE